jgi:UDP-glucose 4-epimerase
MKAVVTGGAGFIGSHIVQALAERGDEVHVIDNYAGGRFPERVVEGASYHEGSVRDTALLDQVFQGADTVFHLAALPQVQYSLEHPVESDEVNVGGTVAVLDAAARAGVRRVVYSASSAAYGEQKKLPLDETAPPSPLSPYALQKLVGEQYCSLFSTVTPLETVCLRYFNVYGPHADPQGAYALVTAKFIEQRKNGQPLTIVGDGTATRDYVHVRDVARANVLAAEAATVGKGDVINIGSGTQRSVLEVAQMIGGETEHIAPRLEIQASQADIGKAQELLGWTPEVAFEEGVAELKHDAGLI